jgi:hypothetical protein
MSSDHRPGLVEVGRVTVPCGPQAPSLARTAVARWLDSPGHAELVRDACLLVSELVSNSSGMQASPPARR